LSEQVRVPPHSAEAEQSLLGSVILDSKAIDLLTDTVKVEDFYVEANRQVYQAMVDLTLAGYPIDATTLYARLKESKPVEAAGGIHYILQLANRVPSATNVRHYARIVKDRSTLRGLIDISAGAMNSAYDGVDDVPDFLDEVERQVFGLAQSEIRQGFTPIREVIKTTFVQIEALYERQEKVTGVRSGFVDMDEMTAGFQSSDLIILAARPSMGKTALALNFLANAAVHTGVATAFFSLEMSKEQLAMRLLCSEARVDASRLRAGFLTDQEWTRLIEAAGRLSEAPIFIDDTPAMPVMKVQAMLRRLKAQADLGMVVIDYLQLMKANSKMQSREQEISDISRNLKGIAKELNLPVVALSQLNRGVDSRTDKRPMLSDLRESGAIEQDADLIMFIYRDEVYNKESQDKGIAEVILAKQRNGPIGTIKLKWFGHYTRFENLAKGAGESPF